jgi:hypothetical protein
MVRMVYLPGGGDGGEVGVLHILLAVGTVRYNIMAMARDKMRKHLGISRKLNAKQTHAQSYKCSADFDVLRQGERY